MVVHFSRSELDCVVCKTVMDLAASWRFWEEQIEYMAHVDVCDSLATCALLYPCCPTSPEMAVQMKSCPKQALFQAFGIILILIELTQGQLCPKIAVFQALE